MSVLRLLAQSFAQLSRWNCTGRGTVARRRPARPSVTILEDRTAPALLTVNSLADGPVSAASSALTLREAVALIDAGGTATDSSGHSLATAKASQINTVNPFGVNDVIQFAPNLLASAQQQIVLEDGSLLLDHNAIISGPAASQLAVSGNNQSTVFEIAAGAAVDISGLTVEAGAASSASGGGGIVNRGTLTLTNTIVSGNTAVQGDGGGLANTGTLTLVNSTVSDNVALNDGGLCSSGTLTLIESTVSGNTAVLGNGGLANYGGAMALVNSTITGNSAVGAGGLGNYSNGTATLLNSTVSGNSASIAGGICNTATLTLIDSTVSDNTASNAGGGIYNLAALTLTDSIVSGNTAGVTGGGLSNYGGTATLLNSTISGNTAADGGGVVNSASLMLTESTVSGNAAINNASLDNSGALMLIESTVSGNTGGDSGGSVNTAALALTGRVVSGDSIGKEDRSGGTDAQTLAGGVRLANSSDGSANIGAPPLNDGAVSGGAGDDGDAVRPIDNALSGRLADDVTVSSDSTGNGNSSAEANVQTPAGGSVHTGALALADGGVSRHSAGDAREETGKPSGRGQETISLRSRVNPAWEGVASPMISESNPEDDRAERFVLLDREGLLDQAPGVQAQWTTGELAGLLLPWLSNGGCPLEGQSAQPPKRLEHSEDHRRRQP